MDRKPSSFITTIKELGKYGPFRILGAGMVVGVFTAIQLMLKVDFQCPCGESFNVPYGMVFFLLPGISFAVLNVLFQKYGKYRCGTLNCREFTRSPWHQMLTRLLTPLFLWAVVVFLDGNAFACMASNQCNSLKDNRVGYLVVCRVKDQTAKPDEESCYRFYVFVSRVLGLCLVAAMAFVSFLLKFTYLCEQGCACLEEDRQTMYEERAQSLHEDLLMEVLLEKYTAQMKGKINKALETKETFWTEIENIYNVVGLPESVERGEHS